MQGFKQFSKAARDLLTRIQKIDGDNYPEVQNPLLFVKLMSHCVFISNHWWSISFIGNQNQTRLCGSIWNYSCLLFTFLCKLMNELSTWVNCTPHRNIIVSTFILIVMKILFSSQPKAYESRKLIDQCKSMPFVIVWRRHVTMPQLLHKTFSIRKDHSVCSFVEPSNVMWVISLNMHLILSQVKILFLIKPWTHQIMCCPIQ